MLGPWVGQWTANLPAVPFTDLNSLGIEGVFPQA